MKRVYRRQKGEQSEWKRIAKKICDIDLEEAEDVAEASE